MSKLDQYHAFGTGAHKETEGKLRYDLVPWETEEALAEVVTFGAKKYEDRNYEKGIPYMSCVAAMRRHLASFLKGEDINEESGLPHMTHVLFWASALTTFIKRGRDDLDDRVDSNFKQTK